MANKPMDDATLSAVVKGLLDDSIDYSEELGEERIDNTSAYNGEPYGNEVEGRSKIVTREVRDAIEVAKPALMRIFFGSHRVLEYAPVGPEDVEASADATDYVHHVINNVNPGYIEFLGCFDDSLIRRTGIFKVWWEESETPKMTEHSGLTQLEISILEQDDEVTDIEITPTNEMAPYEVPGEEWGPDGQPMEPTPPEPLFDAKVTRITTSGRERFEAVPPEEFVIHRKARNVESSWLTGHYREVSMSDLREMGYSEEAIEDLGGSEEDFDIEKEVRSVGTTTDEQDGEIDESMRMVPYAELWVRVDYDGDGIAELRRVCVAGSAYKVLANELADEAPFAIITPSPVAHQAIGHSLAELATDIQKIKTSILRATLDSLASAIDPDVVAVENEVNFDDLLNSERGRIIRARRPGMVEYLTQQFVGKEAFPMLQYMDTLVEARTGMNEAAQGLNADALQSTAKSAIDNATEAAMGRIEFIARTFIEGGIKRLFKLLLKTAIENVDRPTMIRRNNRFIPMDPRSWNASMDTEIAIPLGTASLEQRLMLLQTIAQKQEQAIQLGGPDNPIAGLKEYSNTLIEITKLGGIVDPHRHFKDPNDPASQPAPPPPPPPSPEEILAQAELERTRADTAKEQRELELKIWEAMQKDDRERDKQIAEVMLKAAELRQKGAQVDVQAIKNQIEQQREGHQYALGLLQQLNQARAQEQQARAQQTPGAQ